MSSPDTHTPSTDCSSPDERPPLSVGGTPVAPQSQAPNAARHDTPPLSPSDASPLSASDASPTAREPITLGALLAPVKWKMVAAFVCGIVGAGLQLVPAIGVTVLAQHALAQTLTPTLVWTWFAVIAGGLFASHLVLMSSTGWAHVVEGHFRHDLRMRIARHIARLPLGWHHDESSGRVHTLISEDVAKIHTIIAHFTTDFGAAVGGPLLAVVYLSTQSWVFALTLFAWVVLLFVGFMLISMFFSGDTAERFMSSEKALASTTIELVDGIATVKAFGHSGNLFTRFSSALDTYTHAAYDWMRGTGKAMSALQALFTPAGMLIPVLGMGIGLGSMGWITPVTIVPFILLGVSIPTALIQVSSLFHLITLGAEAAARLGEVLSEPELPEPEHPTALPKDGRAASLVFEDVTFRYHEGSVPAVEGVNLVCEPGTVTAVVGPSGSGKTTLVRLAARFWDVTSGSVRVNGVDVRDCATSDLLSSMTILLQQPGIITDTVWENIRLARPHATDEQVQQAARSALIHDRIMEFPAGYDTVLGADGAHLSGGERQRIALARAFLADAPLLLLDEATSQTDPHSEHLIQQALTRLTSQRTVLVIAHRLSTVEDVDRIVVLDEGRIVESGTHRQLVDANGVYRRMWEAQQ